MSTNQLPSRPRAEVFIATTVMLSFISFWRAAAIVLSDLASSAYYAGGEAEHDIGKSAPWFILAVMLFSYAVRALYIESSAMFVRGGVYRVVREAMGDATDKGLQVDPLISMPPGSAACHTLLRLSRGALPPSRADERVERVPRWTPGSVLRAIAA